MWEQQFCSQLVHTSGRISGVGASESFLRFHPSPATSKVMSGDTQLKMQ